MRRASCASTSFMSSSRGWSSASRIACGVISWNTIRFTGTVGLQHLEHVPADRFALAVLVGREDELVGALQRALQLGDDLLLRRVHDVDDVEVVVGVDAGEAAVGLDLVGRLGLQFLLVARQVADVPDARHHRVRVRAEVARDGLRLGR